MKRPALFLPVFVIVMFVALQFHNKHQTHTSTITAHSATASYSIVKLNSKCHVISGKADRHCTPGTTFQHLTRAQVCTPGWATAHRDVSLDEKHAVYDEYGIVHHIHYTYEIDHLIPLEVGGNNAISNLWPESQPGARTKDQLENATHLAVCNGSMTLRHAWSIFRKNFTK